MKLLRNPELRRELLVLAAGMALLALAAGLWLGGAAAAAAGVTGLCLTALHLLIQRQRYQAMAELSQRLDRILHGQDQEKIEDSCEGELAVLRSEIQKMVGRLQESADALRRDRQLLQEAMADISHQLRTPLTAMALTLSLLDSDATVQQRQRCNRELRRQLQRMEWLIETLLKLSRLDAGIVEMVREPVTAAQLIRQAAAPLEIALELREITLEVQVGDETFTGDPAWSAEALGNVLKNCMEHTPAGGTIWITARETALFTQIEVQDSGPGIRREDLPHLFERFYRGRDAAPDSVGIGLALARTILSAQNGTITAGNGPGGGAQFFLRFYKSVL